MSRHGSYFPAAGVVFALAAACAHAQTLSGAGTPVEAEHVAGDVYVLSGGGGANSSLLVTSSGALLVDSKSREVTDEIIAIAEELAGGGIRFLVNGHVHPDHTDGNENFGTLGVTIVGHEEVRQVLAAGQRGGPPSADEALPTLTFADGGGLSLHLGDERVSIFHAPPAHSNDNSIVHYETSNVLHLGDLYSPSRYPVIAGGTFAGFIEAAEIAVARAGAGTRIVPGVGGVADSRQLQAYRDMLVTVGQRVAELVTDGKTLDEVIEARPTRGFDEIWGAPDHRLFLPVVYAQLSKQAASAD